MNTCKIIKSTQQEHRKIFAYLIRANRLRINLDLNPRFILLTPPPRLFMRAVQQLVDQFSPHLFLQINKANKAHNGGYLSMPPQNSKH